MLGGYAFVLFTACYLFFFFSFGRANHEPTEIRLVGGQNEYEGRVEVRINDTWGTICDSYPSYKDAAVVCRQLGFRTAERAANPGTYGTGDLDPVITYPSCRGTESTIDDCTSYFSSSCNASRYSMGVLCSDDLSLRLVGGGNRNTSQGRLEVYHSGIWGTVCDDYFSTIEAEVVCKELGFPGAITFGKDQFGPGNGPIWLDNVNCGSEEEHDNKTQLSQCSFFAWNTSNCRHDEDIGVVCRPENHVYPPPASVRLVSNGTVFNGTGPRTTTFGRAEVLYNGVWGTVCDDGWGIEDANVFCRQLGFDGADLALAGSNFEFADAGVPVLVDEILCHGNENGISNCPHAPWNKTDCSHREDAGVICADDASANLPVRVSLRGLNSTAAGLLTVEFRGIPGTVCDDNFDLLDGDVACQMLGYSHALEVKSGYAYYDLVPLSGRGPVWIDDLVCNGTESSIVDCNFPGWGISDCRHYEDVFLVCSSKPKAASVRLVFGESESEGIVQVYHDGRWGSVCDNEWDNADAKVVCGQLGFLGPSAVAPRGQFGQTSGKIWVVHAHCNGTENFFQDCISEWGSQGCYHFRDAGVTCTPANVTLPVRLVGGRDGSEGRVEVRASSVWGTICSSGFDTNEATVICRQLGFFGASQVYSDNSTFGSGAGPVVFSYSYCGGEEKEFGDCYHYSYSWGYCSDHSHDVGIKCAVNEPNELRVRLVGGSASNEGRVEVYLSGAWGTVCDDGWSDADAVVVCRQLGYPTLGARAVANAQFGQGSSSILLDEVTCSGGEASLLDCSSSLFIHNCYHWEDAGVVCAQSDVNVTMPIRLRINDTDSTNEGRVEVYNNEAWGSICDSGWSYSDAIVVCRTLGFRTAVRAYEMAHFGPGSGSIWLTDVECSGEEPQLSRCTSSEATGGCDHSMDAGVACTNFEQSDYLIRLISSDGSANSGRLEVQFNGTWGTVCNDGFGLNEANVVCRQLGFQDGASRIARQGEFSQTPAGRPIWLDDLSCAGDEDFITECDFPGWGNAHCTHFSDVGLYCSGEQLKVRLVGGNVTAERAISGRVEVFYNGTWGTVCDDLWTLREAMVVCRELGFATALEAPGFARFGQGSGPIFLDDVACLGSEPSIFECSSAGWGQHNCRHSEDASAICSDMAVIIVKEPLRLAGGRNASEGRVEIKHEGVWGTVCDDFWTIEDANVVCRMQGFSHAVRATSYASQFGRGSGPIWLDDVQCLGTENNIFECLSVKWEQSDCSHYEDAGVVCASSGPVIRLVNGYTSSEGRIEVFYNGTWGTVCDDGFGINEADVACKELGFLRASKFFGTSVYGAGTNFIWLDDVNCTGEENSLFNCDHLSFGSHNCRHYEDVSVACTDVPINPYPLRLVDQNSTAGRVEIFYHGEWGSICDDSWDIRDANVACRSLGFRGAWSASSTAEYGAGQGIIWLDDLGCNGTETFLQDCQNSGFSQHNCRHLEDAGVSCQESEYLLRLVNASTPDASPSTGRLEVLVNNQWGTVCDDQFDVNAASVACRMLGFGGASAVHSAASLSQGGEAQPIWLDDVVCQFGNETSFRECTTSEFGINNCRHNEDVGISCFNACPNVDISNGSFQGEFMAGKSLNFSCNVGYLLDGAESLTCSANAKWSGSVPQCKPGCPPAKAPVNGQATYPSTHRFLDDTVLFSCDSGYTLQGDVSSATCLDSGDWNNTKSPSCQAVPKPSGIVVDQSKVPVIIGVIVAVVVALIIIVAGVAVVAWQCGKWQAKRRGEYQPVTMRADNEAINFFTSDEEGEDEEADDYEDDPGMGDDERPLDI